MRESPLTKRSDDAAAKDKESQVSRNVKDSFDHQVPRETNELLVYKVTFLSKLYYLVAKSWNGHNLAELVTD